MTLTLPMMPRRVYAHSAVRADVGRVAIMRGPVVYCAESADNGANLHLLALPRSVALIQAWDENLFGGAWRIKAMGLKRNTNDADAPLYAGNASRAVSGANQLDSVLSVGEPRRRGDGSMAPGDCVGQLNIDGLQVTLLGASGEERRPLVWLHASHEAGQEIHDRLHVPCALACVDGVDWNQDFLPGPRCPGVFCTGTPKHWAKRRPGLFGEIHGTAEKLGAPGGVPVTESYLKARIRWQGFSRSYAWLRGMPVESWLLPGSCGMIGLRTGPKTSLLRQSRLALA